MNFNDPSGLLAKNAVSSTVEYWGKKAADVASGANYLWQRQVAASTNETIGGTVDKFLQGSILGPEYAAAGAVFGSIKAVVTSESSVSRVVAGQGGRFGSFVNKVGDDLTGHHIPQAALNFTSKADGGAIVMTTAEHAATRTFTFKGAATAIEDAATSFRDVLAKDIKDVRSIIGNAYNKGLQDVTKYYR